MPPKIYKSLDSLKPKLKQYEPHIIQRRIGSNSTVVFAIRYLRFNPKIPILDEETFASAAAKSDDESEKESVYLSSGSESDFDYVKERKELKKSKLSSKRTHKKDTKIAKVRLKIKDVRVNEEKARELKEDDKKEEEDKDEEKEEDDENEDEQDEDEDEDNLVDRLVVTGPEEDEFRQYDDEEEEHETVISRNLKKIRCDPPIKPPQPPPKPPKPTLQFPPARKPDPVLTVSVAAKVTRPEVAKPQEVTIADVNRYLDQKNFRVVYVELNKHKDKFKLDETGRSTLKRAVFLCLERDESFMLIQFIDLVFEYNYSNDPKFWDELVGKLKRKDNPHAKCHSFKCDTDPILVLRNYQKTTQMIVEHFEATNPTLALPWHTYRYLMESYQRTSKPVIGQAASIVMNNMIVNQAPKMIEAPRDNQRAQENLDPIVGRRNVSLFRDTDGKQKFMIKVRRREAEKSIPGKLLIT